MYLNIFIWNALEIGVHLKNKIKCEWKKSEDENRKRFSANDVFIFTHSYTRHQSLIQTSAHEFEPLFYTSYQYPSQLEFNLFFFRCFVRFESGTQQNRCVVQRLPSLHVYNVYAHV